MHRPFVSISNYVPYCQDSFGLKISYLTLLVYIVNSGRDYILPVINLQIIIMNSSCSDHGYFYPDIKPACKISFKIGSDMEESKGTFLGLFYVQFW